MDAFDVIEMVCDIHIGNEPTKYIYLMTTEDNSLSKIGLSVDPLRRLDQLKVARPDLHYNTIYPVPDSIYHRAKKMERLVQDCYYHRHYDREWFHDDLQYAIRDSFRATCDYVVWALTGVKPREITLLDSFCEC